MILPNNLQSKTFDEQVFDCISHYLFEWKPVLVGTDRTHKIEIQTLLHLLPLVHFVFSGHCQVSHSSGAKSAHMYEIPFSWWRCPHLLASDPTTLQQMPPYLIKEHDSLPTWELMGRNKIWMRISLTRWLKRAIRRQAKTSQSRLPPDGHPDGTYDCKRSPDCFL